jgi:FAD/FMN-containing dehydrogenase
MTAGEEVAVDGFRGQVLRPGDGGYDAARQVFNRAVDRRPALLARPVDAADVATAVRHARDRGLPLAVRAGGHNFAGHAVLDGGLVLDLRGLTRATVDPSAGTAVLEPGLTWGEADAATQVHGLATPGGSISTVGVAGFSLGTGLGWLGRRDGLAGDALVRADVVTAEGDLVTASADEHADLWWALRGGAGNFGVVTALTVRAAPVTTVLAGSLMVPIDRAGAALTAVCDATAAMPDALNWTAVLVTLPPDPALPPAVRGLPTLLVNVCWAGEPAEGERHIAALRGMTDPVVDLVEPMPFAAFQRAADASAPEGARWDVRSEWLTALDARAVQDLLNAAAVAAAPLSELVIRPLGGAIAAPPADASPFSFRHAGLLLEVIAGWLPGDDRGPAHRAWMQDAWARLARRSAGGPDISHLGLGEGEQRVRACFSPATYARLVDVKRRYDPADLFRSTQHIPVGAAVSPTGDGGPGPSGSAPGPG